MKLLKGLRNNAVRLRGLASGTVHRKGVKERSSDGHVKGAQVAEDAELGLTRSRLHGVI